MIAPFYLVLYIIAGSTSTTSVAIQKIPQPSQQSCESAGKVAVATMDKGLFVNYRFVCVKGQ